MATKFEPSYVVSKLNRNIFTVRCSPKGDLADWEQWFLLTSDRHWDNPKSDWDLQIEHLKEARKRNAGIIDCCDFFCAMQGKYDPRSSKNDLRPEHQGADYLDSLVNTASDFFMPYADQFIVIGRGNHEANILKRHETDLIGRMTEQIKYRSGHKIHSGGYGGFVRFSVEQQNTVGKKYLSYGKGLTLHYSHGYGGGGPVTKGVIQTNRKAVYLPDADIVISGHIHEAWKLDLVRLRLGRNMTYHDVQTHVCIPTYKEEFKDGHGGWHVERGAPPKPIGATWLRLFFKYERLDRTKGIDYEIIQAR